MEPRRALFSWRVTRLVFALATFLFVTAIIQLILSPSWLYAALLIAGLGLFALATRGPWDSEASGRNRSVFGFRVRP